ncbi:MAG: gas vesicle protein GvpJ [Nitriliruptor sp.]
MSTMSVARQPVGSVARRPASGTLAEVIDIILDKGLVLDAYVRVSLVGIELLTIEARVVIASVDTYLHFAEATNRLDLAGQAEEREAGLMDLMGGMSEQKTEGAIEGASDKANEAVGSAKDRIKSVFGGEDGEDGEDGS